MCARKKNLAVTSPFSIESPSGILIRYILSMLGWRIGAFVVIALIWTFTSIITGGSLPGPEKAWGEFVEFANPPSPGFGLTPSPSIWEHIAASATRAYGGLGLSLVVFLPLGVLIGSGRFVYRSAIGLVEFARSIPAFMLILIFLSLNLSGEWARMLCVVFAVGILLTDYVATAMRNVPSEQIEVLRLMGAGPWRTFWKAIWMPILMNAIMPAMRIGVGVALIVALVVETLIQPETGLGVLVNTSMGRASIGAGLALIIVAGFIGWIGNVMVTLVSDILWWYFSGRPLTGAK